MHQSTPDFGGADRWTECLDVGGRAGNRTNRPVLIGLLLGQGVGPEIIAAALDVLDAVATNVNIEICEGGCIGREAERRETKTPRAVSLQA